MAAGLPFHEQTWSSAWQTSTRSNRMTVARSAQANEPGTRMHAAGKRKMKAPHFLHFFIFEDKAAHSAHANSGAVKRFETAYRPELDAGDVVFTDYELVAAKS
jgi:hypothetical protein